MIISASRRSDIPAFYTEWFFNRLRAGYVMVRNPMNHKQVHRVPLGPEAVDCFIFWTKNPAPLIPRLKDLEIPYYFQFTLNPYGRELEASLPSQTKRLDIFKRSADIAGPDGVVWRYDPIIFTAEWTPARHIETAGRIAESLAGYTRRCMLGFMTPYKKTLRNMSDSQWWEPEREVRIATLNEMGASMRSAGIRPLLCSQDIDPSRAGMEKGLCIDPGIVRAVTQKEISLPKDSGQRPVCGCIKSIDIGAYDTCPHRCLYCYANSTQSQASANYRLHDPAGEFMIGGPDPDDKVYTVKGRLFTVPGLFGKDS